MIDLIKQTWFAGINQADLYLMGFIITAIFSLIIFFLFRSLIMMAIAAVAISLFLWFIGMLPSQHPPIPWATFLIAIFGAIIIIIPIGDRYKKTDEANDKEVEAREKVEEIINNKGDKQ